MLTVEALRDMGANTAEGLARCLNNEAFYLKMVHMGLEDHHFASLEEALDRGDARAAFESAHALKGVCANLSLTMLSEPVSELTERLRGKNEIGDVAGLRSEIYRQLADLRALEE